ncbi:hypothetical protein L6164_021264 [Bauhinia variegata]|uniref:Uncharacterized protein n=1 Tax=Bauhinia variegata TaxID=167791 RepID=A0ACB9MZS2_BAUVA|nr:hypothetical protein L6164_021264 [Bauhinia variegata]
MANQPPVRPWFRLASLRSGPAPAPAPAPVPEPRPAQVFPATSRTASAPPSPSKEQVPPPPAPAPARATAPPPPAFAVANSSSGSVANPSSTYSPPKANTTAHPNGSPKTVTVAAQSPKAKPSAPVPAPTPSPLTLPPSQVRASTENEPRIPAEAEPKAVLIEKTIEKPMSRSSGNGEYQRESGETRKPGNSHNGKHVAAKEIEGKEKGIHKKFSDAEDSGTRVITIAGENRGAVMEIVQSAKKHEFGEKPSYLHKKGNLKIKTSDAASGTSSHDESDLNKKDKNLKGRTSSAFPKTAFMNSNVQCVNNSLMYHTSCQHNDPGVHLVLSRKPSGEGFHVKEQVHGQK